MIVGSVWEGMTAEFDEKTGVLTIEGVATAYAYQDALRSVAFVDRAGFRTPGQIEFTLRISDGLSIDARESMLVDIRSAAFLDSPLSGVPTYEVGRSLEPIVPELRVQSSGTITNAMVTIAEGYDAAQDELIYATQHGIQGHFHTATGTLELSGEGTAEQYQAALRSIQYRNNRYNPSAGDRTLSIQVWESGVPSNVYETSISVEPDVVPPSVTVGLGVSYTEDGSPVQVAKDFDLTSRDATSAFLAAGDELFGAEISIVNFVDTEDALLLGGSTNPEISGAFDPQEGRIYLTGQASFADYEQAIRSIYYYNTSEAPDTTPRQISIRLLDSAANGLENQLILTQVIVGVPDPIQLVAGSAEDLTMEANEDPIRLGFEDLVFTSDDLTNPDAILRFTVTSVPSEALGRVRMADGDWLEVGRTYSLEQMQGMMFEPELTAVGTGELSYEVFVADVDTGSQDQSVYRDSISITVRGVSTSTTSEAFVAQMGRDLLGKDLASSDLISLASQLDLRLQRVGLSENGYVAEYEARQSIVREFMSGDLYRRSQLESMYQELLRRSVTQGELSNHLSTLALGTSLESIRWSLLASDEYYQLQHFSGYENFVDAVYLHLFQHGPSLSEKTQWVSQLKQGASRLAVISSIGDWDHWNIEDQKSILKDLIRRESQSDDPLEYSFVSRDRLIVSAIGSDEYYSQFAVPTALPRVLTQVTNAYPFVGKLGDINGDKAGGTLIAPQYVLVAAHSVAGIPPRQLTFTIEGSVYTVDSVSIHPDFNAYLLGTEDGNDIAILKLTREVVGVTPGVLSGRSPRLGEVYSLVGFGREEESAFGTKRVGSTPGITAVGANVFQWTRRSLSQNNSDPGDSGSPILVKVNGIDQVVGVVSGGLRSNSEVGDVATNTRVDAFVDWIRSIVPSIQIADIADAPSLQLEKTSIYLNENEGLQSLDFVVASDGDVDMEVSADQPNLLSELSVNLGANTGGQIDFQMSPNQTGVVHIVVTATTGTLQTRETLTLHVVGRNDPPTIDSVPAQKVSSALVPLNIPLTGISAGNGESGNVQISILDVQPSRFFQSTKLQYQSGASSGLLTVVPSGVQGEASIELEVRDAGSDGQMGTADDATHVESIEVVFNHDPSLRVADRVRLVLSEGAKSIELVGISDGDQQSQPIVINAVSDNVSIVDHPQVIYDPSVAMSKGSLRLTPLGLGQATITLTIADRGWDKLPSQDDAFATMTIQVEVASQAAPWQNPSNPMDVNGDNLVTPLDALTIINKMNLDGIGVLGNRSTIAPPFFDVDGDGILQPVDALLVINSLFQTNTGSEGEAMDSFDPLKSSLPDDESSESIWSDLQWMFVDETHPSSLKRRWK
ncbi:MAG: trypsin-like serine protease [Pirellulales bacterium]